MTDPDPSSQPQPAHHPTKPPVTGLKVIAVIKMAKAILITGIAIGLFKEIDQDLGETVRALTVRLKIDPENHFIRLLLEKVANIDPKTLRTFSVLSWIYAGELYLEGIGLWFDQVWAEYLLVIATGFWIPEEGYACIHQFGWVRFGLLLVNLLVLIYVIVILFRRKDRLRRQAAREIS